MKKGPEVDCYVPLNPPEYSLYERPETPERPDRFGDSDGSEKTPGQIFPVETVRNKIPWELKHTRFHDAAFTVVFLIVVVVFLGIAYVGFDNMYRLHRFEHIIPWRLVAKLPQVEVADVVVVSVAAVFASVLLGFVQLLSMLFVCKLFIVGALVLNCTAGLAASAYFYSEQQWNFMGLTLLYTAVILYVAWKVHRRVAFSIKIIQLCSRLLRKKSSIWAIYVGMLVLNTTLSLFYVFVFFCVASTLRADPDIQNEHQVYLVLIFAGLYLSEIFQNSVQVIVGALCAKWYFNSNASTLRTVYNTFGKCFGSICLGSLLASVVTLLKEVCLWMNPSDKLHRIAVLKPLWKLLEIALYLLDIAVRYFNEYAFAYMAIYSRGYVRSSFKMFRLYHVKGCDTLVNDCIIKVILRLYTVFSGLLGGLTAYGCLRLLDHPQYSSGNSSITWVLVVLSGVVAVQLSRMLSLIIDAYVHVLLICLVEHQDVLEWEHAQNEPAFRAIHPYLAPYPRKC